MVLQAKHQMHNGFGWCPNPFIGIVFVVEIGADIAIRKMTLDHFINREF
jgi:hypothetical protein